MREMIDEDDVLDDEKYAQLMKNQADRDQKILGITPSYCALSPDFK